MGVTGPATAGTRLSTARYVGEDVGVKQVCMPAVIAGAHNPQHQRSSVGVSELYARVTLACRNGETDSHAAPIMIIGGMQR